jgi:Nif-specific regulatory protein
VRLYRRVAAEHMQVLEERRQLQKALHQSVTLDNIVGTSPGMRAVFAEVHKAAPSRSTILIRGESGTGKEAIARAIHSLSPRRDKPFITLNCAALSETLLESELFGHEKGAFTGAHAERKGRFELAHGGTLFLDEIGEVSPAFQAKLLRVLQEREFERVGGNRPVKVDVRLICATNRDLERAVGEGSFRSDLYCRINVISVTLPPLRERRDDIPLLAEHFIAKFNRENDRGLSLSPGALEVLRACYWPGNVRELENCIERTATMTNREAIAGDDFPCTHDRCLTRLLHQTDPEAHVIEVVPIAARASAPPAPEAEAERPAAPPTAERERVVQALEQCGWVQAKAARLLGITPRQLGYALQKHGIVVKKF